MSSNILPLPSAAAISIAARAMVAHSKAAAEQRNITKAEYHLLRGIEIAITQGGFLVPSATAHGAVYVVSNVSGCSCKAAQVNRGCWHAATLAIVENAVNVHTLPTPRRYTAAQVAQAQADIDELF